MNAHIANAMIGRNMLLSLTGAKSSASFSFKFDNSILGCSAIDSDGDLLDFDGQEVMVSSTAIQRSRKVIVVADHLKFQRNAPLTVCSLGDVDVLISDCALTEAFKVKAENLETEIIIAPSA